MTDTAKAEQTQQVWSKASSAHLEIEIVIHALDWLDGEVASMDGYDPDVLSVFIGGIVAKAKEARHDVSEILELSR